MINLNEITRLCEKVAKSNTPVDTGNLRDAINSKLVGGDTIQTVLNATRADYGIYLDDGTAYIKKHKGFFSNGIFNAQIDVVNQYISGKITPLGQMFQNGMVKNNPAKDMAYIRSMANYKEE